MTTRPAIFCDGCDEVIDGGRVVPTVTSPQRYHGTDWHPFCWERERVEPNGYPVCVICSQPCEDVYLTDHGTGPQGENPTHPTCSENR
jgi:hypothetical protein